MCLSALLAFLIPAFIDCRVESSDINLRWRLVKDAGDFASKCPCSPARDICLRSAALPPWCTVSARPFWTTLGWNGDYPGRLNFLGALLILAGAVLLAWTLTTMLLVARRLPLRVGFGLRPTQLVQTGPYARMRHPMYVAESCFWLGIIVLFGSPVVAAVFICVAAMTWIIPKEEKALEEQFGEEYITYRDHVPPTLRFGRKH